MDLTDHAIFVSCITGPANTSELDAQCAIADLDLDDDVDMVDDAECQTAFTDPSPGNLLKTTVTGLIQMPDESPVLGADVELVGDGTSTVSASDGRFFLLDVEDGELLGQRQILKGEFATIAEEAPQQHQCHT